MNNRQQLPTIENIDLKIYKSLLSNRGIFIADRYASKNEFIKENDPHLPNTFSFAYDIKKDILTSNRNVEALLGNLDSNSCKSLKNIIHPNHSIFVESIISSTMGLLCEDFGCYRDLITSAICLETVVALKDINGIYQKVLLCAIPFEFDKNSMLYSIFCFCKVIGQYRGEGIECKFIVNPNAGIYPSSLDKFRNCITVALDEIKNKLFTEQQLAVLQLCEAGKSNDEICDILHLRPRTVQQYEYQMLENAELAFEYKKFKRIDELTNFLGTLYLSGSCRFC
jgi:hypothetical protein